MMDVAMAIVVVAVVATVVLFLVGAILVGVVEAVGFAYGLVYDRVRGELVEDDEREF